MCVCVLIVRLFVGTHITVTEYFQSGFLFINVYSKYCLSQNRFGYFNSYFCLDSARPRNCLGFQESLE